MGPAALRSEPIGDAPETADAAREHQALGWTAAAAIAVIIWLVRPIGLGILLGTLLAFMAQPAFERLKLQFGARWAALATVSVSGLAVTATLGGLGWVLVARGSSLASDLLEAVGPSGFIDGVLARCARVTARLGISQAQLRDHIRGFADDAASSAARIGESLASATASALLALFFAMVAMHYILRHWASTSQRIEDALPLRPAYTAALLVEFRRVGRTTLLGSAATSLVQGVFATLGFWITGVPDPVFFGVATAIASFVPAVGVLLVVVPVSIGLMLTGHTAAGTVALAWSMVFVVGVSDYVIRPWLVGGQAKTPSLVTFAALFGGVEVLGLKGLIIGPVLMALSIAVLRLYAAEARTRRHLVVMPDR